MSQPKYEKYPDINGTNWIGGVVGNIGGKGAGKYLDIQAFDSLLWGVSGILTRVKMAWMASGNSRDSLRGGLVLMYDEFMKISQATRSSLIVQTRNS